MDLSEACIENVLSLLCEVVQKCYGTSQKGCFFGPRNSSMNVVRETIGSRNFHRQTREGGREKGKQVNMIPGPQSYCKQEVVDFQFKVIFCFKKSFYLLFMVTVYQSQGEEAAMRRQVFLITKSLDHFIVLKKINLWVDFTPLQVF